MSNYIDRDQIRFAGIPAMFDEDGECYVMLSDVRRAIMQVPVVESTADVQDSTENTKYCPNCGAKMDGDEE